MYLLAAVDGTGVDRAARHLYRDLHMLGKIKCRCGWHSWHYPSDRTAIRFDSIALATTQFRECKRCELIQINEFDVWTEFSSYRLITTEAYKRMVAKEATSPPPPPIKTPKPKQYRSIDDD